MNKIEWTRDMLERFKMAYGLARETRGEVFEFEGNEFLVSYAGYLIQFLDAKFEQARVRI